MARARRSARLSDSVGDDRCCAAEGRRVSRTYNVLFLCTGNRARSILAEAILNKEGDGRFRAFSAGSFPKGQVHPGSLKLLGELGYPTEGLSLEELGRIRCRGRAAARFHLHRLRQRGGRDLPDLAGPADDRALGHSRPRSRRTGRGKIVRSATLILPCNGAFGCSCRCRSTASTE